MLNIPPAEDPLLHYLTSSIMKHGRRSKAARITSRTLLHLHSFTRSEPLPLLREAILAASPAVKCLTHRHGAKNVHKPVALGEKQKTRFAVQWILEASDSKPGKTLEERLAREIIAVLEGNSKALAKKMELHRLAMVNRYALLSIHPLSVVNILLGATCLALDKCFAGVRGRAVSAVQIRFWSFATLRGEVSKLPQHYRHPKRYYLL